jgi:septal ring factor EnvC (AmiA/AmiB activator)
LSSPSLRIAEPDDPRQNRAAPMRRFVLLPLTLALAAAPALGQDARREQLREAEDALQRRETERDQLRGQAAEAARELEQLRARLVRLAGAQAGDEADVAAQRVRLRALNAREQALTARLTANRQAQARLLGALQLYSRNPPPALLVSPRSATDAARAAILMEAVAPELQRRAQAFRAEADAIAKVRRDAALAGEALFTAESDLADRRAEIEGLIARKTRLELALNRQAEAADLAARALAARVSDLRGLVRGLSRSAPEPAGAGLLDRGVRLRPPVTGALVRGFGQSGATGRAAGLSWRTEPAAQVVAPVAAAVDYAGPLDGWGQVVVLRLGGGDHLVLAGLERVFAGAGRSVAAGEPVGRMPEARGRAAELYMEVRREGTPVDPARWLDARP